MDPSYYSKSWYPLSDGLGSLQPHATDPIRKTAILLFLLEKAGKARISREKHHKHRS